jgi:hypothetical protein
MRKIEISKSNEGAVLSNCPPTAVPNKGVAARSKSPSLRGGESKQEWALRSRTSSLHYSQSTFSSPENSALAPRRSLELRRKEIRSWRTWWQYSSTGKVGGTQRCIGRALGVDRYRVRNVIEVMAAGRIFEVGSGADEDGIGGRMPGSWRTGYQRCGGSCARGRRAIAKPILEGLETNTPPTGWQRLQDEQE